MHKGEVDLFSKEGLIYLPFSPLHFGNERDIYLCFKGRDEVVLIADSGKYFQLDVLWVEDNVFPC